MKKILVAALLACFVLTLQVSAEPNYREGQWEITTVMDIPGMPKEMKKPMSYKFCMTKQNAVPQPKEQGKQDCKITDQSTKGNTVTWTMKCKDGTASTGKITYAKESFKGSQTTTTSQGGQKMTIKSEVTGKYLGPCPKP